MQKEVLKSKSLFLQCDSVYQRLAGIVTELSRNQRNTNMFDRERNMESGSLLQLKSTTH